MANRRLTQRLIDTLKPGKSVREIRDTELRGFGVRILPSGRRRFFVNAQTNGRRIWKTIGDAGAMSLAEARALARSHLSAHVNGAPSRSADSSEVPFEDVAEAVFRRHSRLWKPGTLRVNRNYLKNQILPWFRGRPVGEITNADVRRWFTALRSTPTAADRAMPVLSVIMREAETLGHRPEGSNPCRNIRRYRRHGRERFLSREEIRRLGAALKGHDGNALAAAVRLLLLTGCRKGEIMTLQWRDYRDGHLFLRDGKTGPRTVWLSSVARTVLDGLPRTGVWVFPGRSGTGSARGLDSFWNELRDETGLLDVRLHDIRHSYASLALQRGETVLTIGRLLGHSDPDTTLKYIHLADQAVRDAVEAVAPVLGGEGRS
ncbi:MAG: tyrosine-type recombinase/integrase [Boseongicola sp. SB0664_bin_43]|uniref:Tyrosine-type recombinase/integrase n=1 Tax=Boseongicola sp. SB0664_bin_43 TaxID=2604844 RepID=A0A6B0Y1T8_9RHOB|nr:tyrosine-type recombinase/integrase [Boseongicola sp. SB0664_bin_43]